MFSHPASDPSTSPWPHFVSFLSFPSGLLTGWEVEVWLYDLSQGMAKAFSQAFIGKQIDAIWHSGIVAYGWEYFYGGGIQCCRPGTSQAGRPVRIEK